MAALLHFKRVKLGLETLQIGSQLMRHVVLGTILGQLVLLLVDEHRNTLLEVVDLNVQTVDGTLEFANIRLGGLNAVVAFVALLTSHCQLLVHGGYSVNQSGSLLLEDGNPTLLGKALLLPLGKRSVVLVDSGLLAGPDLLLLVARHLERLNLTLCDLVLSDGALNLRV